MAAGAIKLPSRKRDGENQGVLTISARLITLQDWVQYRRELGDAAQVLLKVTVAASRAVGKALVA